MLAMPTLRDRGVQGACTRSLEPLVAADCQPGASGERPKRAAPDAGLRVAEAMVQDKPRVMAGALQAYVAHSRPHLLWAPGAQRGNAPDVVHGRKRRRHAAGKQGVAPGGGLSP